LDHSRLHVEPLRMLTDIEATLVRAISNIRAHGV
jgi:hypothetical protein